MFSKTVCVDRCPNDEDDQPECKPTTKNPDCKVADNPFLKDSSSWANICIPKDIASMTYGDDV
jgi:hypothetical protein